ncbi:FMN-binding protein [Shewanella sp. D64]|uniref:FMN-binding protein n=1 Tax=unclassified Shewanella TaxID=196818 RepID=UPI0022BA1738|nr:MULTISPECIES: FMN-binding protein [unclassified Shewanella]MEC4724074.1 FMN-binding protein [Shewanella sp. D64]MEC4736094.1 FMN-binding protein [Shewanella sp. E94]WBJ97962.1 FMN-binding protein [Shewanella sp. MTB7]
MTQFKIYRKSLICSAITLATLALAGCANSTPDGKYVDGSHEVNGKGKKSQIVLKVEVVKGSIKEITTKSHNETESLYLNAERLLAKILANNGHEGIDAVSGATFSSNGILKAINTLPRANGTQPEFVAVGSKDDSNSDDFKLKWSIQPQLGMITGDFYFEEARFRQGHKGSMIVVTDSNNANDVIFAEFNESGRPNYYTRIFQDVPKRMSEYNFSMGKKKGTAWVQSPLTMEKLMVEQDKLTFDLNPDFDPKLTNKLTEPNRLKYLGIDVVAGASNSIQQSMIPLTAKIHAKINGEGTQELFYQNAEKLLDSKAKWTGITAVLRLVVDTNTKAITKAYYDEIFADEAAQIKDAPLKKFYRQSKYASINYVEPARIGFNVMVDALEVHLQAGGSLFDINDLPATGDTGSYAATGFTKRSDSWDTYLNQADILYKQMRLDGVISEHKKSI